ncbi:MAG: cyclic peptide export ABC transporter [Spirulinaceae cyanobacterium RM2_2_10]|nr:cyclic peptide export ABC transporter [Spirulinaceae cyanobacterium SM2_1_0]NJO19512.1 cyclic peptide export ABC transporter [Spirulinaceae cyanobacterium RM2_2_10]
MKLFRFLIQSSLPAVAIAVAIGLLSGGSSAGLIATIGRSLRYETPPAILAWSFAGLAAIALVTSVFARIVLIRLSQRAIFALQLRLSEQILAAELRHLETLGAARLLASLTEDVQAIANAVYVLPFLLINLAIVAGCLLYIATLIWQAIPLVIALSLLAASSTRLLLKQGRQQLARARDRQDALFSHFRAITDGVKELKLHGDRRNDFLTHDLQSTADQFRRHNVQGLSLFATTDSTGKLIFFAAIGIVLFGLPPLSQIPTDTLAAAVLAFAYLIGPMENIVNKLPLLGKADVALSKIEQLNLGLSQKSETSQQPSTHQPQKLPPLAADWQALALRGVVCHYGNLEREQRFVLGPIDLQFQPGELVFIIGGNGSGKSTLAKLLVGLYPPDVGEIHFAGQLITATNRDWYRQHFAVIFSDFYLFDRLLGVAKKPQLEQQVQVYLERLQLSHKVHLQGDRFSTTALSQGQRKRLALLVAYLEDRPIYLFDEWAADQDPLFRDFFYRQLLPELRDRGKTVIAISHDDRYFDLGDRLIKLDYGQIVAQ